MSVGQSQKPRPAPLRSDVGRYAMLPEWLLASGISDKAIRLFGVLAAKYADRDGIAYPSRATLAKDLGLALAKTVDGPLRELESVGALAISNRKDDAGVHLPNIYTLSFARPVAPQQVEMVVPAQGLRSPAVGTTPSPSAGTTVVPGDAQGVVPDEGHDPDKYLTRSTEPEQTHDADASLFALQSPAERNDERLRRHFERIWVIYPRGAAKKPAWKEFQRLNPSDELVEEMLAAIEFQKRRVWGGVVPEKIPHLRTWLFQERWTDARDDVAPVSLVELDKARRILSAKFIGRCPHQPICESTDACLKTIALREREHQHRRTA